MLSPDSRTVAFELLRAPAGYDLDLALLTTYTLDLEALLALPLGVIARADRGVEDLLEDPLLLLEALRQAGERIHVFVDRAGIAVPRTKRDLYAMLEPSVHPVRAPGGGAFHPKVWMLRFLAENEPPLLRVAVLSRNLTFDRSWDIVLASEGSPMPGGQAVGRPSLADFIRSLPDLGVEPLTPTVAEQIQTLAGQVGRTRFQAPEGFSADPIEFHVVGMTGPGKPWCPVAGAYRTLAVAPFVSRTALDSIVGMGEGERMLVSTREEMDKLSDGALTEWNRVCTLSDAALDEPEDGVASRPSGLHAKILALEHGRNVTWFVGSANLTAAAFTGRNVEVMAAVTARKGRRNGDSGYGIERFLKSGFEALCEDYHRSEPAAVDPRASEALEHLEETRDALLEVGLKVVCCPSGDEWTWRLESTAPFASGVVQVTAWPISLAEEQALSLQLPLVWTLPIQRLTSLVAFRLHIPLNAVDDLRFTLKLPVEGMPAERMHHVLRSLIDDPERFLAFLRALLGGLDGMVDWTRGNDSENNGPVWGIGLSEDTLLEDLLRVASRDPGRLEPVRRLIDDFRKTEEGRRIVPDDFFAVWTAVEAALREDGRS